MRKNGLFIVIILCMCLIGLVQVQTAQADFLRYSQDFQTVALGGDPESDPANRCYARLNAAEGNITGTLGYETWDEYGSGAYPGGSDYTPLIADVDGGNRVLSFLWGHGGSGGTPGYGDSLEKNFDAYILTSQYDHYMSFDFRLAPEQDCDWLFQIGLAPADLRYGVQLVLDANQGNVKVKTTTGTSAQHQWQGDVRAVLDANTWYNVKVYDINYPNKNYALTITRKDNGMTMCDVQGIGFDRTSNGTGYAYRLNQLTFVKWNSANAHLQNRVDIDNIEIGPQFTNCSQFIDYGMGMPGDINHDCHVNGLDLELLVNQWLVCNVPGQSGCI